MKKIALIIVLTCIFTALFPTVNNAVDLPIRVVVNGTKINFPDEQPFIDANNRTQTPARFIGEALGATATWDGKVKKATFVSGSKKLVLYIGKKEYDLNGQKKQMDTVALLKNGRTFVPARYVAEAFGATVKWDSAVRTVYVDMIKNKSDKTGTEVIAGFVVPKDRELSVTIPSDKSIEIEFEVNVLREDVEKQIADLAACLSQKCEISSVEQVISYIKQKKVRRDYLAEKFIYDNKSQRCIWIQESQMEDINVGYLTAEDSKPYKN